MLQGKNVHKSPVLHNAVAVTYEVFERNSTLANQDFIVDASNSKNLEFESNNEYHDPRDE